MSHIRVSDDTFRTYRGDVENPEDQEVRLISVECEECGTEEHWTVDDFGGEDEWSPIYGSSERDAEAKYINLHPRCADGSCVLVDCADLLNDARGG